MDMDHQGMTFYHPLTLVHHQEESLPQGVGCAASSAEQTVLTTPTFPPSTPFTQKRQGRWTCLSPTPTAACVLGRAESELLVYICAHSCALGPTKRLAHAGEMLTAVNTLIRVKSASKHPATSKERQ